MRTIDSPPLNIEWSVVKRSLPQAQPVKIDHAMVIRPANDMLVKKLSLQPELDAHRLGRTDNDAHESADTRTHSVTFTATTPHGVNETNEYENLSKLWVPNSGVNIHQQPLTNGSSQSNEVCG